jgi:hypothetical protein
MSRVHQTHAVPPTWRNFTAWVAPVHNLSGSSDGLTRQLTAEMHGGGGSFMKQIESASAAMAGERLNHTRTVITARFRRGPGFMAGRNRREQFSSKSSITALAVYQGNAPTSDTGGCPINRCRFRG